MPREYDEPWELGFNLYWYDGNVLTPDERLAIRAVMVEAKRVEDPDANMEPHVHRLNEAYRCAGERVLQEAHDLSFINRCPRCGRIARTLRARQCRWCHHDWHELS
jgi:hypothetical protein